MTKSTKTTAATRKPRAAKTAAVPMVFNHAETIEVGTEGQHDELAALLNDLNAEEVIEHPAAEGALEAAVTVTETPDVTDAMLEAAVGSAEATDAALASATVDSIDPGAVPTDGEAAAPAKVRTPRVHYSDKVERLQARIGDKLSDYSVLTVADAPVDAAALDATMARTLDIMRKMNKKEQNRASNFYEWLTGKKAKLNNVLERTLKVLARDGVLTTGNEGNVIKDLLSRPYSLASARAMGGNTIGMFADLKVIVADGKGKFVANPDSLLLMKAKSLMAAAATLSTAAAAAEEGADAGEELAAA